MAASSAVRKYPPLIPQSRMVSATRRYQLAHAGLALRRAKLPVQIFAGDNVGRRHRPVLGDLNVLLLEDHAALGVGDLGKTELPLELVIGRDTGGGEDNV